MTERERAAEALRRFRAELRERTSASPAVRNVRADPETWLSGLPEEERVEQVVRIEAHRRRIREAAGDYTRGKRKE